MIFSEFRKSDLLKNTSILISGTAIAQLIPIALETVLRRYFTPETFGAYSVYLSLIGILIVISSLKYELAIILPGNDKESANILFLSVFINLIFNFLVFVIIVLYRNSIMQFLNLSEEYKQYIYLVPLGTSLFGLYQVFNYWLIRKKSFFNISANKFIRRGSEGVAKTGFAFIGIRQGLVWGDIIGHVLNLLSGILQSYKRNLKITDLSWVKIKYVIRKYNEYPKFNLVPGLMSACSFLLPAIFINKYYSSAYAGYFDLSKLVLSIPLALVATSISNVLLQRIAEKYRKKESIVKELIPILGVVLIIAITEVIVIIFWGERLFTIFFGENWISSAKISILLVWSYAISFVLGSFSSLYISMKKIKLLSIWQLVYFLSILSLIFYKNLDFFQFLHIFLGLEIFNYFLSAIFIFVILYNYENKVKNL